MFVLDSIVVVRNPGGTLSPANVLPKSSAKTANAPPCTRPLLLRWRWWASSSPDSVNLGGLPIGPVMGWTGCFPCRF